MEIKLYYDHSVLLHAANTKKRKTKIRQDELSEYFFPFHIQPRKGAGEPYVSVNHAYCAQMITSRTKDI